MTRERFRQWFPSDVVQVLHLAFRVPSGRRISSRTQADVHIDLVLLMVVKHHSVLVFLFGIGGYGWPSSQTMTAAVVLRPILPRRREVCRIRDSRP